jgi:hypothetical protein
MTTGEESMKLLQLYIQFIRPQICQDSKYGDPFFLNFDGERADIGECLTNFFKLHLRIQISINTIRSLVETEAEEKLRSNDITPTERQSIRLLNGHSSSTVRNYYHMTKGHQEAHYACSGFDKIFPRSKAQTDLCTDDRFNDEESFVENRDVGGGGTPHSPILYNTNTSVDEIRDECNIRSCSKNYSDHVSQHKYLRDECISDNNESRYPNLIHEGLTSTSKTSKRWNQFEDRNIAEWGTQHPDYKTDKTKATWTIDEIKYIDKWLKNNSHIETNRYSALLKYILTDLNAMPIFHEIHILNSARIRAGVDAHTKWKALQKESSLGLSL